MRRRQRRRRTGPSYPVGVDPLTTICQFEGLGYIPPTSAVFPDHLLAISIQQADWSGVIEIIRFDHVGDRIVGGTVVSEITFDPSSFLYNYLVGIQYVSNPDRLIVTPGNEVWEVNFDGTSDGPLAVIDDANDVEGFASLPDGRIALADYVRGRLVFLGPDFTRLPQEKDVSVGVGVSQPISLAWNADTQEFLTTSVDPVDGSRVVTAFSFRASHRFAPDSDVYSRGVAFVPAAGGSPTRVAVGSPFGSSRDVLLRHRWPLMCRASGRAA